MAAEKETPRWLPLESNPEVMDQYVRNLGVPEPWAFRDVYGLDSDMLASIPKPVLAVLLLYPLTKNAEGTKIGSEDASANLFFIKQTIGNACGTIGIINSIGNNLDSIAVKPGHLKKLFDETASMTPDERAKYLENDSGIGEAHDESAHKGQTQAPDMADSVKHHFVSFVHKDGSLYELDGRRSAPVAHGSTSADNLLTDAASVIQDFIKRDENENFAIVALVKSA
ncbi:ubiquitin carboxyl-terminal hydrolase isozyme L3-like [Tubulanus polymorphus]|uniref:ubiquitin carboxyl-terminal hydrolase isozyme L3-like n=1 Tax=Tubulanus polymorphus TaxID=672921 RepID=UPI003DA3E28A